MKFFLLIIISLFLIPTAFGVEISYFTMIGYGSYNKKAGAEISLGAQLKAFEYFKIELAPLTGIFIRKNDPRYGREKDENKQLSCRDKATKEVVDNKNCGLSFKYAFESTAKIQVADFLDIGVGARIADSTLVYGVAVLKFSPSFGIEGKYGDNYYSALFRIDF